MEILGKVNPSLPKFFIAETKKFNAQRMQEKMRSQPVDDEIENEYLQYQYLENLKDEYDLFIEKTDQVYALVMSAEENYLNFSKVFEIYQGLIAKEILATINEDPEYGSEFNANIKLLDFFRDCCNIFKNELQELIKNKKISRFNPTSSIQKIIKNIISRIIPAYKLEKLEQNNLEAPETEILREKIERTFSILSSRERQIIDLCFEHDYTLDEIGEEVGLSTEGVRRAKLKALKKIQERGKRVFKIKKAEFKPIQKNAAGLNNDLVNLDKKNPQVDEAKKEEPETYEVKKKPPRPQSRPKKPTKTKEASKKPIEFSENEIEEIMHEKIMHILIQRIFGNQIENINSLIAELISVIKANRKNRTLVIFKEEALSKKIILTKKLLKQISKQFDLTLVGEVETAGILKSSSFKENEWEKNYNIGLSAGKRNSFIQGFSLTED